MTWWQPEPILEEYRNAIVVRDDLIPGGSKMRFLPYLVKDAKEVVYGGPFCGGAPYALSVWGRETGAKVSLFYAKRNKLHERQVKAVKNGAQVFQVPYGYMTNVQAKARKYAKDHDALFLDLGFDLPEASAPFISQMTWVKKMVGPIDEVWATVGSGMLVRCLAEAFHPTPVHGVVVGLASKNEKQNYRSNVILHKAPYKFQTETKAPSPFPSCPNYDRKAWELSRQISPKKKVLFWNVLG